jgi:beta-glucan synthesis-associated protein KRE6
MGNLARAIFPKSTMAMWPWSYDQCGLVEGLRWKQEVSACDPDPGHGLHPHQGRGSPEIDLFEIMLGHSMPGSSHVPAFMSSSFQVSPGISQDERPKNGCKLNDSVKWYDGIEMSNESDFNFGFWGQWCGPEVDNSIDHKRKYLQDAISVNTNLKETHFQKQHKYRLEWEPDPVAGYLQWYLDDELIMSFDATALEATGARIPAEPMYLIFNTAVSHSWGFPEPCDVEHCGACYQCYDCTNPDCQCTLPEGRKTSRMYLLCCGCVVHCEDMT